MRVSCSLVAQIGCCTECDEESDEDWRAKQRNECTDVLECFQQEETIEQAFEMVRITAKQYIRRVATRNWSIDSEPISTYIFYIVVIGQRSARSEEDWLLL